MHVPARLVVCGACIAVLLSACGSSSASPTPTLALSPLPTRGSSMLVILVTDIGGLHDRSFNQEAWKGLKRAQSVLGISSVVRESGSTKRYFPLLTQAARAKADLIIAVGSTMGTSVYAAASQYPNQRFAMVDARPQSSPGHEVNMPNVANLLFKEQESGYLVGAIAGLMEKQRVGKATHNTVAWLGGQDIPPVDAYLAGFEAGARKADPSIAILRQFAGTFGDAGAGRGFAQQQLSSGADIFFQVAAETGAAYLQKAEKSGKYGIGADTDQSYLGSNTITSAIKRVDVAVFDSVKALHSRHFQPFDHRYGIRAGTTGYAPPTSIVPANIVRQVNELAKQISQGKLVPPRTLPTR
jgi:basic membrane protein A and related proteins